MEHHKNLEGNIDNLFLLLDSLERLIQRTGAREKPHMEMFLVHAESIRSKADNMLEELRKGPGSEVRLILNKKVIGYLKDVNDLKEEGKAKAESIEDLLKEVERDKLQRFTLAELDDFTENFKTKLGEGGYGIVYKGKFPDNFPLAVKVLHERDVTSVEEAFMAEVRTMGRTSHRNLVKLYGFCFTIEKKALVYEYMEKGSLDKYLYNQSSERIEWGKLYQIATETAWGLIYLHEGLKARIIHHDVKPANVLLDSHLTPKLSDFGVAKLMNRDLSHVTLTRQRGTPGFAAPEMWIPESPVTYKCDVYSFGIMLFEILGRRRNLTGGKWFPFQVKDMIERSQQDKLFDQCDIKDKEDREKAMILCRVALQCIQKEAESRPTMSSVMNMLKCEIEVSMFPPQLSPPQLTPDLIQELNPDPQSLPPSTRVEEAPRRYQDTEEEAPNSPPSFTLSFGKISKISYTKQEKMRKTMKKLEDLRMKMKSLNSPTLVFAKMSKILDKEEDEEDNEDARRFEYESKTEEDE